MALTLCAVLVADLAGFSTLSEREGVHAAREAAHRFWLAGEACAVAHGGTYVKGWADNVAATFPTVEAAVSAGQELINHHPACVGIGWGEVLIEPGDVWGVEVNRAFKLGEDTAGPGEILLTPAARTQTGVA